MKINPAEFAKRVYKGRLDKKGEPHISHLARVASHFNKETDYNRYAAAWLHTILEDTGITFYDLDSKFGFRIASIVATLSREEDESVGDYARRISSSLEANDVKIADLEDHLFYSKKKLMIL